jgi:hypothetical protein
MGLDFMIKRLESVDAHFSYKGFMLFRYHIVRLMGIDTGNNINIFDSGAAEKVPKDDPLFDFIFHCDCDGELDSYQCGEIGPRLKTLLENWNPTDVYEKKEKESGLKLANAMIKCSEEDAHLIFC